MVSRSEIKTLNGICSGPPPSGLVDFCFFASRLAADDRPVQTKRRVAGHLAHSDRGMDWAGRSTAVATEQNKKHLVRP